MLPADGDGSVPPLLPLPQVPDVVFPGLAPVLRDLLLPAVLAEAAELPRSPTHPGRLRAQQLGCFLRLVLSLPSARSHGSHPKPSERWPGLSGSRAAVVSVCPYVPKVPSRLGHTDTWRGVGPPPRCQSTWRPNVLRGQAALSNTSPEFLTQARPHRPT